MRSLSIIVSLLVLTCISQAQTPDPADKIMEAAYKQAAKENKNIFVIFHASWCGWCHRMDTAMNDASCKKFFTDNYVIVHLTVEESAKNKGLENPGGLDMKTKYHGDKAGLPFWLVLDSKGNLVGDSYIRPKGTLQDLPGANIGCPAEENEVAAFVDILKRSSKLNEAQLAIIATRFKKNKG